MHRRSHSTRQHMTDPRITALRIALVALGLICASLGPLMLVWPSGWRWSPHHSHYEQMMVGLYFTLGIFLLVAAKDPLRHLSVIWFTVWSSVVHGSIMAVQALAAAEHRAHLFADVPALFIAAAVLALLTPRKAELADLLPAAGYLRVPLTRSGVGHFHTAGTLNGRAVEILVDTGAASTVVAMSVV